MTSTVAIATQTLVQSHHLILQGSYRGFPEDLLMAIIRVRVASTPYRFNKNRTFIETLSDPSLAIPRVRTSSHRDPGNSSATTSRSKTVLVSNRIKMYRFRHTPSARRPRAAQRSGADRDFVTTRRRRR